MRKITTPLSERVCIRGHQGSWVVTTQNVAVCNVCHKLLEAQRRERKRRETGVGRSREQIAIDRLKRMEEKRGKLLKRADAITLLMKQYERGAE